MKRDNISKTKINLKLIITLFGVALVMCLVPLGVQALATDEATDVATNDTASQEDIVLHGEGEPEAPSNEINIHIATAPVGELFTFNDEYDFTVQENENILEDFVDHVGYLYIKHVDGSQTCIAAAFSHDQGFNKFSSWSVSGTETEKTYTAQYDEYDPVADGYCYQAVQMVKSKKSQEPIVGAEVSWVNLENGTYIKKYTNNFGFACLKIPFGIDGSIHVIASGFVSDYSIPTKYNATEVPGFWYVEMISGPYCSIASNTPNAKFHIYEYVSNDTIKPRLEYKTEDVYLSELPTRMLSDGSSLMVLTDEICDRYNLLHGSLYYSYAGARPLGANLYEIVFEPDPNYNVDNWVLTSGVSNGTVTMEVGKEYMLDDIEGPYSIKLNLSEKVKPTAQTGDNNLPIVIALIVFVCACGGFITYRKIRNK